MSLLIKNNSSRDEIHEKNSRINSYRLKIKWTICKGVKKHKFWTNYWNTREAGYNM
jgi:hypothetical protein